MKRLQCVAQNRVKATDFVAFAEDGCIGPSIDVQGAPMQFNDVSHVKEDAKMESSSF